MLLGKFLNLFADLCFPEIYITCAWQLFPDIRQKLQEDIFAQVVANCSLFSLLALPAVKSNSIFLPPDGGIALVGEFGEKMLQHSLNSDFGVALAMALGTKRAKNI